MAQEVFAGEEGRLDSLPDRGEVWPVLWFVAAGRSEHGRAECGHGLGELASGVAFIADDRLATPECPRQQRERDLAFGPVGSDERCSSGCPVGCAGQMQPHPPKPARVA